MDPQVGDPILVVLFGVALKTKVTRVYMDDELSFDVLADDPHPQEIQTACCRSSEEGRCWARGWDDETAAALQAAWTLSTF